MESPSSLPNLPTEVLAILRGEGLKYDWDLSKCDPECLSIAAFTRQLAERDYADLLDYFPFRGPGMNFSVHLGEGWVAISIRDAPRVGMLVGGKMPDDEAREIDAIVRSQPNNRLAPYIFWKQRFGEKYFGSDRILYVGPTVHNKASWQHAEIYTTWWIHDILLPRAMGLNTKRVQRATPLPPQFNTTRLLASLVLVESADTQGTAFALSGVGLVTCNHVLRSDSKILIPPDRTRQGAIKLLRRSEELDLAVFSSDLMPGSVVEAGSSDALAEMDHLLVAGFPNNNFGDVGFVIPGVVIGFRTRGGVRNILTNAPIVVGNSGGPVVDKTNRVIGVAARGSPSFSASHDNEDHAIIPIEILSLLHQF